jgi:hypothetical protein
MAKLASTQTADGLLRGLSHAVVFEIITGRYSIPFQVFHFSAFRKSAESCVENSVRK